MGSIFIKGKIGTSLIKTVKIKIIFLVVVLLFKCSGAIKFEISEDKSCLISERVVKNEKEKDELISYHKKAENNICNILITIHDKTITISGYNESKDYLIKNLTEEDRLYKLLFNRPTQFNADKLKEVMELTSSKIEYLGKNEISKNEEEYSKCFSLDQEIDFGYLNIIFFLETSSEKNILLSKIENLKTKNLITKDANYYKIRKKNDYKLLNIVSAYLTSIIYQRYAVTPYYCIHNKKIFYSNFKQILQNIPKRYLIYYYSCDLRAKGLIRGIDGFDYSLELPKSIINKSTINCEEYEKLLIKEDK